MGWAASRRFEPQSAYLREQLLAVVVRDDVSRLTGPEVLAKPAEAQHGRVVVDPGELSPRLGPEGRRLPGGLVELLNLVLLRCVALHR